MAGTRGVLFLLFAVNFINLVICSTPFVPVMIWQTPSIGNVLPSVSAVDKMSKGEFEMDMIDIINKRGPVVFFLQDDLSLEDFTLWGNVYGQHSTKNAFTNLEALLETNNSTMLPAVESPQDSIPAIANGRSIVEVQGDNYPSKDEFENSLLIYRLPKTLSASDRQQALRTNDEIIGNFITKVAADSSQYTAFYTSQQSSWAEVEKQHVRVSRHALVAEESNGDQDAYYFNMTDCYLIYFADVTLNVYTKKTGTNGYDVSHQSLLGGYTVNDDCFKSNNSLTLTILFSNNTGDVTDAKLDMTFMKNPQNDWYLSNVSISATWSNQSSLSNDLDVDPNLWAPLLFSYHCNSQKFTFDQYNVNTTVESKLGVTFGNFQVQPFNFTKGDQKFGDPFDCVGFFTIAIWMTIMVVAILIITLGYGVNMIMNINTVDRFDDPKGKTITVNASD